MLISIVIPVYNSEKTLIKCIESLIKQTYPKIELIFVNDGSNDNSLNILMNYQKIDNRIIIINKENEGVSSARNIGIDKANGKYIMFVDSDDYCDYKLVSKLYERFNEENVDFSCCGIIQEPMMKKLINVDGIFKVNNEIGNILNNINRSFVYAKLFKKEIIVKNNIRFDKNLSMGEDSLFVAKYLEVIQNGIISKSECLYHYVNASNISLSKKYHSNIVEVYEKIYNQNEKLSIKYNSYKIPYTKDKLILTMSIQNLYSLNSKVKRQDRIKFIKNYMENEKYRNSVIYSSAQDFNDAIRKFLFIIKSPRLLDLLYTLVKKIKK